jgi:MFS family permease
VRRSPRTALAALCATQVVSWGVLYYAFPVALAAIIADTGWPATAATGAFSVGLVVVVVVVSAVVGVPVGHWLDRIGPRRVMTAGSVLAVPATLAIAAAGQRRLTPGRSQCRLTPWVRQPRAR